MKDNKIIHVSVSISKLGEGVDTSFYFGEATVGELYMLNGELDILKQEILNRIKDSPKDYEVQHYYDEGDED